MNLFLLGGDDNWKLKVRDGVDYRVHCFFPTALNVVDQIRYKTNFYKVNNADVIVVLVNNSTVSSYYDSDALIKIDKDDNKLLVFIVSEEDQFHFIMGSWLKKFENCLVVREVDEIFDVLQNLLPNKVIEAY